MSEDSNPHMNMTEEQLIESCANDDGTQRAIKLVEDWLRSRRNPPSADTKKRRRRAYIERRREEGHDSLFNDYFSDNPVYTDDQFRRRFRMRKHVFLRIVEGLGNHSEYFQTRRSACGRSGLSTLQKCTAAVRMLAYGVYANCVDEYVPIGESTMIDCVKKFVRSMTELFGDEYLRKPNVDDVERLMVLGDRRGFLGMMGSIDSMQWEWKNCPDKWKHLYVRGNKHKPKIMVEIVVTQDMWIWHAFFGCPRWNNKLDAFGSTPWLDEVHQGVAPQAKYTLNGKEYRRGYYLTDGIFPDCPTFVKSIRHPLQPKEKLFAQHYEEARKDVERAFRALQTRFAIVRGPGRVWDRDALRDIICACIILHNMIVEDEREISSNDTEQDEYENSSNDVPIPALSHTHLPDYESYLQTAIRIREEAQHHHHHQQLKADLVEHLWQQFGIHN